MSNTPEEARLIEIRAEAAETNRLLLLILEHLRMNTPAAPALDPVTPTVPVLGSGTITVSLNSIHDDIDSLKRDWANSTYAVGAGSAISRLIDIVDRLEQRPGFTFTPSPLPWHPSPTIPNPVVPYVWPTPQITSVPNYPSYPTICSAKPQSVQSVNDATGSSLDEDIPF